jgi:cell division protein FtsI (penicillin-binding protein 3)
MDDTRLAAVTDANEPGSPVKAITAAIALMANDELAKRGEKPLFDPLEKMPTWDSRFPGRKPLTDTHFHRYLNMDMAVWKSSNIYPARLVQKILDRLGADWYKKQLHQVFGFGEKTGIELPYENPGLVPTPGKKHPNGALEWSTPTPISMAMGHNLQASAVQLARAYCVFANGGYLVEPTLVRKIVKDGECLVDNTLHYQKFRRVLDPKINAQIAHALKFPTKTGGTARRGDINGYSEAGKTGTAQKVINGRYSETVYNSSFVGYAPCTNPAFVLVVTMDEPQYGYIPGVGKIHHGGVCSAPVFREIGRRALEYLGETPDDPYGYPAGDPRRDPEKADWVKETRRLQEIYEKWNKSDSNGK